MAQPRLWLRVYQRLLSPRVKTVSERAIIMIAIVTFFIHLGLIELAQVGVIDPSLNAELLRDPIDAIYTPFSFILFYEVYALVYYIPRSVTYYIAKQYEIITLIVIRRIFKDLSNVNLEANWWFHEANRQFVLDTVTTLVLFLAMYVFYRIYNPWRATPATGQLSASLQAFIRRKKMLATALVPVFVGLAIYSFTDWLYRTVMESAETAPIRDINTIFFNEFFVILILSDVLLLLLSLLNVESFHKVIRNSGFVISTIMIRLSFEATGVVNNALIAGAVVFGVLILLIHWQFERLERGEAGAGSSAGG